MFSSRDIIQKPYFGQNLTFQSAPVTLKIRSRSPKSNQPFLSSQQCFYASLVKIHRLVQKITHRNHMLDVSKCYCDLENRSRSPKFNQLFLSYQQCIYASLVKIHPLVQKITCGNHILDISKWRCDLEN